MLKILNVISTLCLSSSAVLSLNSTVSYNKTQSITPKTSNISNAIITWEYSTTVLKWKITLSNSIYDGFSGFMQRVSATKTFDGVNYGYALFFFQWLNNNNFDHFPDLTKYPTKQGSFYNPFSSNERLDQHFFNFDPWASSKSFKAFYMIFAISNFFMECAYHDYTVARGVAGIQFFFEFGVKNDHSQPFQTFIDLGHSYKILY